MTSSLPLAITRNLISLERDDDELLLINGFVMQPLYVARGKGRVRQLLARLPRGRTLEQLAVEFPGDAALIRLLRDHRILVSPADKEGFTRDEMAADSVVPQSRDRMTAYLLLTEACNLDCAYCLNGKETYFRHGHAGMSSDTAIRSLTTCLDQVSPGGSLEVAFFGGEPLLNWKGLKEVIHRCETELKPQWPDKRISYHLTSNLTVCPPDLIQTIKDHQITVVSDVDGPAEIHDRVRPYRHGRPSHAETADTLRRLADAGIPVALRATVTSANQDCIPDVVAHHKALGAVSSAVVPMSPVNSDRDLVPADLLPDPDAMIAGLIQAYRSGVWPKSKLFPFNQFIIKLRPGGRQTRACSAPFGTMPVIRVNGEVYVCIYLVGQEPYRFGSLDAPWRTDTLTEMVRGLHVDDVPMCRDCAWRYACGGGCPVLAFSQKEWETRPDMARYIEKLRCDFTQAIVTELLWDHADAAKAGLAASVTPDDVPHIC